MVGCQYSIVLLVPLLVLNVTSYDLICPKNVHRTYRSKSFCNATLLASYSCLLNEHTYAFQESCEEEPNYVRPGQRYVINGFRTNTDCSGLTYQPFKFWSQKYSECIFIKSLCNGIGQMLYENASITMDNKCRCDHNNGYAFVVQPRNTCYCVPTEEDCTCIIKKCPSTSFLSSDYNCMPILTSSELSLCQEGLYTRNTRKTAIFNKLSKDTNDERQTYRRRNYTVFPFLVVIITAFFLVCLVALIIGYFDKIEKLFECSKEKEDMPSTNCLDKIINTLEIKPHSFTISPSATCITVSWDKSRVKNLHRAHHFEIKYKISDTDGFKSVCVSLEEEKPEIVELKSNTLYNIKVFLCDKNDKKSVILKTTCKTNESCAQFLMDKTLPDRTSKPYLYTLEPVAITQKDADANNDKDSFSNLPVRYCEMIDRYKPLIDTSDEKTLLILGATGTGKSTWINALINYTAEVSYNDDHRFVLINKTPVEESREENQCQSQTSSVTVYRLPKIKGFKVNFKLNIIDTPGFNDTRQNFDKLITTQIANMFEDKIDHLDAVLVVVQSSSIRLTEVEQYVFSRILEMFGKDIAGNVFVILTHHDGGNTENCVELLRQSKVPFDHVFQFNNSNVLRKLCESDNSISQNETIWNNRTKSFNDLFKQLEITHKTTVASSIDVMRARINLEIRLKALEEKICEQAQNIANYIQRDYKEVLKAIQKESPENRKHAKYHRVEPVKTRQFYIIKSINCKICKHTCHKKCLVPSESLIRTCDAMSDDRCTVCKCHANQHIREHYAYKTLYVKKCVSGKGAIENQEKRQKSFSSFLQTLVEIEKLMKELKNKALVKDFLDMEIYIQDLIKKEELLRNEGFEMRVKILKNVLAHLKGNNSIEKLTLDSLMLE